MIKIYHRSIKDVAPNILNDFKTGSWIYVENPNDEELDSLGTNYGLERGHLTDALDVNEVPRLEAEGVLNYIFIRVPFRDTGNRAYTVPVLIVIAPDFLLTLMKEPLPFLERFINAGQTFNTTQKTNLFIQIISQINSAYSNFLQEMSREVRQKTQGLEEAKSPRNTDIVEFLNLEKTLNDFLAALIPTAAILEKLLSGRHLKLYKADEDLVEDLFLGTNQLVAASKANLRNISNLRDAYSTVMTNNLNQVIKLFTSITVLITIPTMIASFYGMNVSLPYANNPFAFPGIILGTMIATLVLLAVFIKNRWL